MIFVSSDTDTATANGALDLCMSSQTPGWNASTFVGAPKSFSEQKRMFQDLHFGSREKNS